VKLHAGTGKHGAKVMGQFTERTLVLEKFDADHAQQVPKGSKGVTEREVADIEERAQPRTPVIYEVVRRLGEEEMARPPVSLWWSGVAAGLSISFSLLAQAVLYVHLPDAIWRPLVTGFGYSVGFLMVVLSRQPLFTENTITVVLLVMKQFSLANLAGSAGCGASCSPQT
jgi:Formate/nitrite transporter